MILKEWCNFTIDSGRSYVRESVIRIPDNGCNSFPAVRMIVQSLLFTQESPIKIYLVDSEYGLITNYGIGFQSFEQAKFIADVKLVELGFEIKKPFILQA
jgi:hypothetical protein